MSYDRWKYVERRVAEQVGGARNLRKGNTQVDVEHPWLSIEVKSKLKLPDWMAKGMRQAITNAKPDQLPALFLHEKNGAEYVVIRTQDAIDWFGFKRPKDAKVVKAWEKQEMRERAATPSPPPESEPIP